MQHGQTPVLTPVFSEYTYLVPGRKHVEKAGTNEKMKKHENNENNKNHGNKKATPLLADLYI